MGEHGKSRQAVDWVALVDQIWTSDDENSSKTEEQIHDQKVSTLRVVGCEHDEKAPGHPRENLLNSEQFELDTVSKVVDVPTCLSEDPLTNESDICHTTSSQHPSPTSTVGISGFKKLDQGSRQTHKTRQTDLLSFIDQNYSQTSRAPLTDVQNLTCSDSTDDGYMTLDNSRAEYTPQLSLPEVKSKTKQPRALFSHKTTRRHVRKRKASELIGTTKRSKVCSGDGARKENEEQLYLDLGQKNFGHVTCKVCGMVYTCGQPTDQAEHLHFHKSYLSGVKFAGWKKEHIVDVFHDGRIIMVLPTDPKLHLRKVEEIRKVVDIELGYASGASLAAREYKVFLYISLHKRVMGCVIAETITQGYQVLSGSQETEGSTCTSDSSFTTWLCSTDPQPAELGINRLWVSASCRRKGIASKLLDAARSSFVTGYTVPKTRVAFSDPTPDGKAFASHYSMTPNFLVYRWM